METVQDIKYKVFYSCIVCLLLFKNNNHQTNKTLAKSSDGARFLYCLWNWLSDEKKGVKATYTGCNHKKSTKNVRNAHVHLLLCS